MSSPLGPLRREARRRLAHHRMRKQIDHYFTTGERPTTEPAASYIDLIQAFDDVANASIGGQDYDEAVERYGRAQERYRQASQEVTL